MKNENKNIIIEKFKDMINELVLNGKLLQKYQIIKANTHSVNLCKYLEDENTFHMNVIKVVDLLGGEKYNVEIELKNSNGYSFSSINFIVHRDQNFICEHEYEFGDEIIFDKLDILVMYCDDYYESYKEERIVNNMVNLLDNIIK